MFGLLPKEEKYFDLFNQMAVHIKECTALLKTLFEDASRHQEIADQIKKVEHQCDEITHDIVRKPNPFMLDLANDVAAVDPQLSREHNFVADLLGDNCLAE